MATKRRTNRVYPPTLEDLWAMSPVIVRDTDAMSLISTPRPDKKPLSEIQRIAVDLELERFLQQTQTDYKYLTFEQCIGVGTGKVCGAGIHTDNGVLCLTCWERLDTYIPRQKCAIYEYLILEYSIRYKGACPPWILLYDAIII